MNSMKQVAAAILVGLLVSCTSSSHKGPRFQVLNEAGTELFTERDLQCVRAIDPTNGDPSKSGSISLRGAAVERFSQYTAENIGKPLSVVLCGETVASPLVQTQIKSGMIQIPLKDKAAEDCFRNISAETPACPSP